VREAFAAEHPDITRRVVAGYETARRWALAHPDALKALVVAVTKLPPEVIARQIDQRTDLAKGTIDEARRQALVAAGEALKSAGVLPPTTDVQVTLGDLIDTRFQAASGP
jgi:sulfonate transport system substrate-binding protein